MKSNSDVTTIWVSPENNGSKYGTYDAPFTDITKAINNALPGTTIILKAGRYNNSVTIQNSGTIDQPIRIIKEKGEKKEILCTSSWYFYDVSDIIISGLTFKDSPYQALSIIGECKRNNFNNLRFVNCGLDTKSLCTFFFAGPGAESNVVEHCSFEISLSNNRHAKNNLPIGLMISDGDSDEKTLQNKNHIFRNNIFLHYGCAIVIGTKNSYNKYYSHIVQNNYITDCTSDGIRVNCGDIIIKENIIKQCREYGISIEKGKTNIISENRIEECKISINVGSHDCSIINNCIIRSGCYALSINTHSQPENDHKNSILIENNTFIDSGRDNTAHQCEDILFDTEAFCIFKDNLFYRKEKANLFKKKSLNVTLTDIAHFINNVTTHSYNKKNGCTQQDITFYDIDKGNYTHNSSFGASGWVVEGKGNNTEQSNDIQLLNHENNKDQFFQIPDFSNSDEEKQMYLRSFFINAETASDEAVEKSDLPQYDDDITDFSTWD